MEMEAFDEGTLAKVYVVEGPTVQVGQKLALLVGADEPKPSASKPPEPQKTSNTEKKAAQTRQPEPGPAAQTQKPAPAAQTDQPIPAESGARVKTSPLAREGSPELGVELQNLPGSRPGGRIVRDAVLSRHEKRSQN